MALTLGLPDGSTRDDQACSGTASRDRGDRRYRIGATTADTAANIEAALAERRPLARRRPTLPSASAMRAATRLLRRRRGEPAGPRRGPALSTTATALRPRDGADTVIWYTGDTSAPRRAERRTVRIGDGGRSGSGRQRTSRASGRCSRASRRSRPDSFPASDGPDAARYAALAGRVSAEARHRRGPDGRSANVASRPVARGREHDEERRADQHADQKPARRTRSRASRMPTRTRPPRSSSRRRPASRRATR